MSTVKSLVSRQQEKYSSSRSSRVIKIHHIKKCISLPFFLMSESSKYFFHTISSHSYLYERLQLKVRMILAEFKISWKVTEFIYNRSKSHFESKKYSCAVNKVNKSVLCNLSCHR